MDGFGRLLGAALALLFAIPCGALTFALIATGTGEGGLAAALATALLDDPEAAEQAALALSELAFAVLVAPPVLAALFGGVLRWRGSTGYGALSGGLSALMPWLLRGAGPGTALAGEARVSALLFVSGAVSGLVYWFAAVRGRP